MENTLRYLAMVALLTAGIAILGSTFVEFHPITFVAERVQMIVDGAR